MKSVVVDDRSGKLDRPSPPGYSKSDYDRSWYSQEWKSEVTAPDRSGKPDETSWNAVRQICPHHGDALLDGKAHSVRYGEILHDGSGQPDSANFQEEADSEIFVMGSANQLQKKCRKKHYENIHDRIIRDKLVIQKKMIELGRLEEIILEMDRFASEDHSHIATKEEIDVYRGNWWIRSNVVNFDTMPTRHQPDFKKALSTLYRLKKAEDKKQSENWSQSSSSWWQWQTNWWESDYETSPQRWTQH